MGRHPKNYGERAQDNGTAVEAAALDYEPPDAVNPDGNPDSALGSGELIANGTGNVDTHLTGTRNEGKPHGNNGETPPDSGLKRVCNPDKKGKKLIVGDKVVEFDVDGAAELDDADAAYLLQIPGYKVL
jgi:hypothetical protein